MSTVRSIVMSSFDHSRLSDMLATMPAAEFRNRRELQVLSDELKGAEIVPPDQVPEDVVTLNSSVVVRDLDTGETETFTIVTPEESAPMEGRMSILAPLATALIGYRVGDTVTVRAGLTTVRIESLVYQPERAGHFDR